ncbi:MAG: molybdopterin-dependent oxidoreductase, partial [Candidatus Sericytochromatia bacterium]|nr:molybdopterin-dependent oxidoreductase [Candidatus Tanganyikabacteria bacterium]
MGLLQDLAQDRGRFRAAGGGVREFAARWMPLGRAAFLEIWRRERAREANPLRAWAAFAADEAAREAWQKARGGGALQELHWEEALEIVAAALLHIARTYGPDRVFGLAGAPGDADPTWIGGTRFLHLFGGVALCSCEGGGAAPGIGAGGAAPGIGAGGAAPGIG